LGNPLPHDVCDNLGLAVVYLNNSIPEYDKSALLVSRRRRRISRNESSGFEGLWRGAASGLDSAQLRFLYIRPSLFVWSPTSVQQFTS
jgi:hypothetical protein